MKRSYENALKLLESRRRKARPKGPAAAIPHQNAPAAPSNQKLKGVPSLVGMSEWLKMLGHSETDVNNLNIVHITGTKGKGSTCAFTRSFLRAHSLRTGFPRRIGLYTSPDLQCIRERIQIDDKPITEDLFTRYFFEVWERLASPEVADQNVSVGQPRYLQFLALLAFHTFIREKVQAAIFETHHGGEYDATNVIRGPIVTAITSLGMDHVDQLGPTIENVAWHKSGIFKKGAPALTVKQEDGPTGVMRGRAGEKGTSLRFVETSGSLPVDQRVLSVPVQRLNCSLALEIAREFVRAKSGETITDADVAAGVEGFSWIGRFEVIEEGESRWFIDGAHNTLSLEQAAEWFARNTELNKKRVLIFSHFSEERDGIALVNCLAKTLIKHNAKPDHVIFTTYQEREDGSTRIDKTLKIPETPFPDFCSMYASLWKEIDPEATVSKEDTIEGAINLARRVGGDGMQAFVTGSLHLVGGALNHLRP